MKPLILQGHLKMKHFYLVEEYLLEASIFDEELIIILINTYVGDKEYIRSFERLKNEVGRPVSMVGVGNIANPIFFMGDKLYIMPGSYLLEEIVEDSGVLYNIEDWELMKDKLLGIYGTLDGINPYYHFWGDFDSKNTQDFFEYSFARAAKSKPAIVLLCSKGGEVTNLWVMLELVKTLGLTLITLAYRLAASSAAEFTLMSDERYLVPGCMFMLHGSRVKHSTEGKTTDVGLNEEEAVKKVNEVCIEWMTAKTQLTEEMFMNETHNLSEDWFVPEEKWANLGIITGSLAEGIESIKSKL